MRQSLIQAKIDLLRKEKLAVRSIIIDAILTRYFYVSGLYEYKTKYDDEVLSAIEILKNKRAYNKILKP